MNIFASFFEIQTTMSKKNTRMEAVKMIISSREVAKQEELLDELRKTGFPCTQATLSRDLKQLRIVKAQNSEGRYVYMLPETRVFRTVSDTQLSVRALNSMGVLNIRFSGTLAVVKTLPGYASHVAYDIDNAQLDCVLGTVAGDDTVIVVLEEETERTHALNALSAAAHYKGTETGE